MDEARLAESRMTSTNSCLKERNHKLPRKNPVLTLGLIKARVSLGFSGVLCCRQYLQGSKAGKLSRKQVCKGQKKRNSPAAHQKHSWVVSNQSKREGALYLEKKSKHNWTTDQWQQKQNSFAYNILVCLSACGLNKFLSVFSVRFFSIPPGN